MSPTAGKWTIDIENRDNNVYLSVYETEHLNKVLDLGVWRNESSLEGISNAVLMTYAKDMHHLLKLISKYGSKSWIVDDVDHLLDQMDSTYHDCRRGYAKSYIKHSAIGI